MIEIWETTFVKAFQLFSLVLSTEYHFRAGQGPLCVPAPYTEKPELVLEPSFSYSSGLLWLTL